MTPEEIARVKIAALQAAQNAREQGENTGVTLTRAQKYFEFLMEPK